LKSKQKCKTAKDKFTPDERHISEEQRAELKKLSDRIVDRLMSRHSALPDEELKEIRDGTSE